MPIMKVWILLPAFNEVKALPLLIPKISHHFDTVRQAFRIVVVNDGSFDGTAECLEELKTNFPIDVIEHKINRGLGETERDGFEYVAEHASENDILVRLDCDNTHEPEFIQSMIDKIHEGYDVVTASRFQPGGGQRGVSFYRAFVSYSANVFMKILFNIPGIKDYSCGYRAYRVGVIQDAIHIYGNSFIQLRGLGFTSTLETIVKLKLLGCLFKEIPFTLYYDQKTSGSKMTTSITALGYFMMAFLYHWPFGGWRRFYSKLPRVYAQSPDTAYIQYARRFSKPTLMTRFGG